MWTVLKWLGLIDNRIAIDLMGAFQSLCVLYAVMYERMDMYCSFIFMFGMMPYVSAWIYLWYKGDTESNLPRKGLYYCARVQFLTWSAMYSIILFMLYQVISMIGLVKSVVELEQTTAYRVLPRMVTVFAEATEPAEDVDSKEEDEASELTWIKVYLYMCMLIVIGFWVFHYYALSMIYSYYIRWRKN